MKSANTAIRTIVLAVLFLVCAPLPTFSQPMAPTPKLSVAYYGYELLERLPMARDNFTQGLQIVGDTLYVGTGMHGESRLREYDFPAMTLRREKHLEPNLFGEGVTRLNDRIYQLTWRAGKILVYDATAFELLESHAIGTEGWGITHDGENLYYSDGSSTLRILDAQSLALKGQISVTLNGQPLPRLNELEWIEGEIWANVWGANQLVRIDPASGAVTGIVDLRGLLDPADRQSGTDVLNGIAWDSNTQSLWVTGKRWPWLYRVRPERQTPNTP